MRYLSGTRDYTLTLGDGNTYDGPLVFTGYSDSDGARDIDARRSVSVYVFRLGSRVVFAKTTNRRNIMRSHT